jgi:anti-sigma regulatory factor (Ser/Thr protein kinase)
MGRFVTKTAGVAVDVLVTEMRQRLEASPEAPRLARRFVGTALNDRSVPPAACETAALLVSELVTNAVVHTETPDIEVEVRCADGPVRVEVRDRSARLPEMREHAPDEAQGRGLEIVDALAARWGSVHDGDGKAVWFEIIPTH